MDGGSIDTLFITLNIGSENKKQYCTYEFRSTTKCEMNTFKGSYGNTVLNRMTTDDHIT